MTSYITTNHWEFTIHWDDSKPLILNKETPVMTNDVQWLRLSLG